MATFREMVATELQLARAKHQTPINSPHEGYAVILEELDELWEWVRLQNHKRDPEAALSECVQIAAMAQRFAEDLRLTDPEPF